MCIRDRFGKYALWLDRAAIRLTPNEAVALDFGRFANPFQTSELLFDADLNFDGAAVTVGHAFDERLSVFSTLGGFTIFNTALNFGARNAPDNSPSNGPYKSQDKYLVAAQGGAKFQATRTLSIEAAVGYFHYENIAGAVSAPCAFDELVCSTDATRPAFQQHGNTLFPIRNVIADPKNPSGSPEYQYFGLASGFGILNLRLAGEYRPSERFGLRIEGDYVKNLAWDGAAISALAVNNLGPDIRVPDPAKPGENMRANGPYEGGDTGWQVRLLLGSDLNLNGAGRGNWRGDKGDWNAYAGYRHLESDAVVDAFADSDLHIGGTNNKGWMIGGAYVFAPNTLIGARWMSADEIAGAPFSVDRLFIDLSTRF